jgi:MFS family permease
MASGFILIPNLPTHVLHDLGLPGAQYPWLVFSGGVISFVTLRAVGPLVDRFGSFAIATLSVAAAVIVTWFFFVRPPAHPTTLWIYVIQGSFMVALGSRNVAYNALTSKVPRPHERARFLSIQSTVYHAVAGASSWLATTLLHEGPNGTLAGISHVAILSIALSLTLPLLVRVVEARVGRESATPPSTAQHG